MVRPLNPERDIAELLESPPHSLKEGDIKNVLRRYCLQDTLKELARLSVFVRNSSRPQSINEFAWQDKDTEVPITQFALSYLAALAIVSGANDYKSKRLSTRRQDNLCALCAIYLNQLPDPIVAAKEPGLHDNIIFSFLFRTHLEQLSYQYDDRYLIARTVALFCHTLHRVPLPNHFEPLPTIFQIETGISMESYLKIAFAFYAGLLERVSSFDIDHFATSEVASRASYLDRANVQSFLRILACDYATFRCNDAAANSNLAEVYTKFRFNSLLVSPIIQFDDPRGRDHYVIPNFSLFVRAAYQGLYWWFHRFFERSQTQKTFRDYFGSVFQEYVGDVLKGIYGPENVSAETKYDCGSRAFVDWIVEQGSKTYLFEAKAYQLTLLSRQEGNIDRIAQVEMKRVVCAAAQVYKRVLDIARFEELNRFRNRHLVPVIVLLDFPFAWGLKREPVFRQSIREMELEGNLPGLSDFEFHVINIEELEICGSLSPGIDLEFVLKALAEDRKSGLPQLIISMSTGNPKNSYLEDILHEYLRSVLPSEQDS